MASSPSSPENRARCGSWSRASGATDSQASRGMYGGLHTTTSTVPARSSKAVAMSPWRRSTPVPARLRSAQPWAPSSSSTACTRASGTSSATARAIAPDPVQRSTTTGASQVAPARVDRPAGQQLGLRARHEDPRPDGSSTWRNAAVPVRCCSGSRAARRATSASYRCLLGGRARRRRGRAGRAGRAEHVGEQLARRRARGLRPRPRAARRRAGRQPRAARGHCSSASSRAARSASTHDCEDGPRSPSSTWSRL